MAEVIVQNWVGNQTNNQINSGVKRFAQGFIFYADVSLPKVTLSVHRFGNPGNVTLQINAADGAGKPTLPLLATATRDGNGFQVAQADEDFDFGAPAELVNGTLYTMQVFVLGADAANYIRVWQIDNIPGGPDPYPDGKHWFSGTGGAVWIENHIGGFTDMMFKAYGETAAGMVGLAPGAMAKIMGV